MITHFKRQIEELAQSLGYTLNLRVNIERPDLGDLSSQLYQAARTTGQTVETVFAAVSEKLSGLGYISSVSLDNGYLNIKLNWRIVFKTFGEMLPNFFNALHSRFPSDGDILVEYSQPNTHKPFHVGHLRNACLGSAIVNLLRAAGKRVIAINYPGDIGTHVARCIWYLEKFKPQKPEERLVDFLGNCYTSAVSMLELECLTEFPYTHCVFGEVVEFENDRYRIEIEGQIVDAEWGGDPIEKNSVVVLATRDSKLFKLISAGSNSENVKYKIVPEKFLNRGSSNRPIIAQREALGQDPVNYFRIDRSLTDVINAYRDRNREVSEVLASIENGVEPWFSIWKETRQWCLDELDQIYSWLGCEFQRYYFESELTDEAQQIVDQGLSRGLFEVRNGAVGIDLGNLGFLVLRKSDGSVLYATRDIALAYRKSEDFDHDESYYIVDQAQSLHFKQVFETLRKMGFDKVGKLKHLGYALVVTKEGKISSRSSNYYTFWQLKELATETVFKTFYRNNEEFGGSASSGVISDELEKRKISEKIAKACIRYGMLKVDSNTPVVFDLNDWLDVRGNSGAYIMYTYARFRALKDKADSYTFATSQEFDFEILHFEPEEIEVLRMMLFFDEWFTKAVSTLSPNVIAEFLYLFSQSLNKLYNKVPILKADHSVLNQRLLLVRMALDVMDGCFRILGIDPLQRV